jgi:hypothetical protein
MKYHVRFSMPVHFTVEVESEDEESAMDEAMQLAWLSGYVGNGGRGDKLVGTTEPNVSLDPGECVLEGNGWKIEVEQVGSTK